jgi:glutathione-regulated potassium-efflux system ancillary protein KefF
MSEPLPTPLDVVVAPKGAFLVYAHPYPGRSLANRTLLERARSLDGVTVRSLYEEYPDFDIDVDREQAALSAAELVIWQHPMYWYSVPGLLKHWFDKVLARGWAYGRDGTALRGKRCLWAATTGGDEHAFSAEGMHERSFESFSPVIEQTARFCGMRWLEPHLVHGAHRRSAEELSRIADGYRARIARLLDEVAATAEATL